MVVVWDVQNLPYSVVTACQFQQLQGLGLRKNLLTEPWRLYCLRVFLPSNDATHLTDLMYCEFAYSFVHMELCSRDQYWSAWLLELAAV